MPFARSLAPSSKGYPSAALRLFRSPIATIILSPPIRSSSRADSARRLCSSRGSRWRFQTWRMPSPYGTAVWIAQCQNPSVCTVDSTKGARENVARSNEVLLLPTT